MERERLHAPDKKQGSNFLAICDNKSTWGMKNRPVGGLSLEMWSHPIDMIFMVHGLMVVVNWIGPLSTRHGSSSAYGWRRMPPGIYGSSKYIV
jgi:hypothetical protein